MQPSRTRETEQSGKEGSAPVTPRRVGESQK